ncbi:hypothetical protein OG218_23490 [Kineococcus sp. NBC_00420]|uniref:hypothetical protein n=1 Tax=unclassified Kineococcus TaxID=2621656 RepID=UPI002E216E6B
MRPTQWTWKYEDVEGRALDGDETVFPTQSDAEVWIGESWRELRARGVENAHLWADGAEVYGPLSLRPVD